jgi:hypothetical protein
LKTIWPGIFKKGELKMKPIIYYIVASLLFLFLAVGCGSNKNIITEFQDPYPHKFSSIRINHDAVAMPPQRVSELETKLTNQLIKSALMGDPDTAGLVMDITIVRFNYRTVAARYWLGGMAGQDIIESDVIVSGAGGQTYGAANITTYNAMADELNYGLIGSHVRAIVDVIN